MKSLASVSREEWKNYVLILPVGSIESHGVLPPALDVAIATCFLEMCEDERAIYAPPIPVSTSWEHMGLEPTISVGVDTFAKYLKEVVESSSRYFKAVMVLCSHGGSYQVAYAIARELTAKGVKVGVFSLHRCIERFLKGLGIEPRVIHADPIEASLALACLGSVDGVAEVSKDLAIELAKELKPLEKPLDPWTWVDIGERFAQDTLPGSKELGIELLHRCCEELREGIDWLAR